MAPQGDADMRHLSLFHLEALRLGVAAPEERSWVERHGAGCARCQALVAELQAWRNEAATRAPPDARAAVRRQATPGRSRWWWLAGGFLAPLAATAAVLLTVTPAGTGRRAEPGASAAADDPVIGEKGAPALGIVARRGSRVFPIRSGDRMRPGDQIRFVLGGVTYPFGIIASIDGAGVPNIYVPYEGDTSVPLTRRDRLELEGSIVLDGRLGPERIFALFSRSPLSAKAVRQALAAIGERGPAAIRQTRMLAIEADAQASVLLEKVAE